MSTGLKSEITADQVLENLARERADLEENCPDLVPLIEAVYRLLVDLVRRCRPEALGEGGPCMVEGTDGSVEFQWEAPSFSVLAINGGAAYRWYLAVYTAHENEEFHGSAADTVRSRLLRLVGG